MMYRRLKVWFMNNWVKLVVITAVVLLIFFTIIGLASLESFYLNLTLATLPLQLLMTALNAVIFVYLYMSVFQGGFSKMKKSKTKAGLVNVKFSDVIGLEQAKKESWEIVQLIKDRSRLKAIGGKILRGMLMVGPPGCGKTLLAKAIATEAGIPFISIAGSEFVEVFVGVGASRVRKLFKQARQLAYAEGSCIVFIDEIEVIGRGRTFSFLGGGEETNSTQNQLLVEMDGLGSRAENVIVIGATNANEDVLDAALLRPGRFDRKIYIDKPNLQEREQLYRYYLSKVRHDPELDIGHLARKSVGKSPADIENVVKEAALIATRFGKEQVEYTDMSKSIERIELGVEHRKSMNPHEREMVAYHETGHLVTLYLLHPTDDVFKASIISRGQALGVVHHSPREELFTMDKQTILANVKVAIAGYVAEKLRFGTTSTGVASDFQNAMNLAHNMVWRMGMGGNGYLGDFATVPEAQLSESLKERLNAETEKILKLCYDDTERTLKKNWKIVERFVQELLVKEELDYDEIDKIFAEFGKAHPVISLPVAPTAPVLTAEASVTGPAPDAGERKPGRGKGTKKA
ncbi:MAG: ATP-dependent zinc metalloprotease FtsH [Candidatus Firestonebacteria bacterium]|nr:ATP-dependent zinc metalloprotease FtsH [Candidatus Firestonebacteria bacterium]